MGLTRGEQRGEDDPSDARQGSQDRHVALLGFVLPVIAGKRGAQSVEAALRVADLAVDQLAPFGESADTGVAAFGRPGRQGQRWLPQDAQRPPAP
jgi:hypothetical protein